LALAAALALYGVFLAAGRSYGRPSHRAHLSANGVGLFFLLLTLMALLILGTDLFYVDDFFNGALRRTNTVFKLYYEAWILGSVVAGFSAWYLLARWDTRRVLGQIGVVAATGIVLLTVGITIYYPVVALASRVSDGHGLTLNGLAYLEDEAPAESAAIEWIQGNTARDAVVLESAVIKCGGNTRWCSDFSEVGRISASTGRPTVLGWYEHEYQWRKEGTDLAGRFADVTTIYMTADQSRARGLLVKYGVDYVVFGPRETAAYGTSGLPKFLSSAPIVFTAEDQQGTLLVFDVRQWSEGQ
jgi:uncharacterized membrane protein